VGSREILDDLHALEPQITIGLLTDAAGFPLMAQAFEGTGSR
jgi:hypothetical protein